MNLKYKLNIKKIVCVAALLIIALLSMTVISKIATSPESYTSTIQSIDEKKATVMGVAASATATSMTLAAIPVEATKPIANQIMDLSSYLLIVVCALVLEKSLLTVIGYMSFNILVPVSCVLLGIYTFVKKQMFKVLALKFIVFAMVIVTIIPFSMKVSDMIYEANKTTVENATTKLEVSIVEPVDEENESWINKMIDTIDKSVSVAGEKTKEILNSFIDAIALFIITYCALPIVIFLLVIWVVNLLFGLNIPIPDVSVKRIAKRNKHKEEAELEEAELIEL